MVAISTEYTGIFPVLNEDKGDTSTTAEEIPSELLEKAKNYVSIKGYDLVVFLQVVWALTLKQYIDTELFSFALGQTEGTELALKISQVSVTPEDLIEDLWKKVELLDYPDDSSADQTKQNTGLLISGAASTSDPAALLNEFRKLQKDCQALLSLVGDSQSHRLVLIYNTSLLSSYQAAKVVSEISQIILELLQGHSQTVRRIRLSSSSNAGSDSDWHGSQGSLRTPSPDVSDSNDSENSLQTHSHVPSVLEAIRAKTIEQPDATAICAADGELTYAKLDATSTQLAFHLRGLGVGPNVMVPLLFHRCQWVIVAQLAVLKAGGAFVPLDPVHPDARLKNIIGRTECKFLLTSEVYADRGSMIADNVICVSHSLVSDLPHDENIGHNLLPPPYLDTPAYVLFTSGSTGEPKGCVMQHRAMAQIPNQIGVQSLGLSASSRVLQFTSYGFAISIFEIYHSLCLGATICIPSDHDRINRLVGAMEEMKITWSIMTPSLLRNLDPSLKPPTLKTVLLSGEPVFKEEFEGWAAVVDLVQVYGASEGCGPLGFMIPQPDAVAFRPLPNLRFWVADAVDHHELAPVGVVGELIIEGPSLAHEYLNDPITTSSAFIDAPSWRLSKSQLVPPPRSLYRTGDLFRQNDDGSVTYVARKALDVKIRGKRVDLKEVEYHVRQCCPDAVRVIAVAVTLADAKNIVLAVFLHSPRYILDQKQESLDLFASLSDPFRSEVQVICAKLVEVVPDHMWPALYIPLGSIPMTVTGKVDMRVLRNSLQKATRHELEAYRPAAAAEMVEPVTEIEKCLHGIFAQVLGINDSSFGVHHSFISLGGDSLSAMKVVSLCQTKGYPELTVEEVLRHQTIQKLALILERPIETQSSSTIPPPPFSLLPGVDQNETKNLISFTAGQCKVPTEAIQDIYPCTALQEGLMISTIKARDMYIARCIFDLTGGIDVEKLKAAWQATVDANVMLRTRIVQSPSEGMIQAVLSQDQSIIKWASFASVEAFHKEDKALSMGPGDPLVRFSLIRDPSSELSLGVTLHHAIFDFYSLGLLLAQTRRAYFGEALESNTFSPFIQTIQKQDISAKDEFWKTTFADLQAPAFPSLPHDQAVPVATAHLEQTVTLPLKQDLTSHYSEDVVFGVTVAGRATPTPGVEEMAGPTIATVPFRARCHQTDTVADALSAIQALAIRMIPFEQTGLQNIRQMSPETASACDFQSQLIFQQPEQIHTDQKASIMNGKTANYGLEDFSVFINYAIGLICTPSAGNKSLHLNVHFDRSIVPEPMANRLVNLFAITLQQLCADQNQRLEQLSLVSPQDLDVMKTWNGTVLPAEHPHTLHGLILQNAQKEPLAPAVSSWDQSLTYQGLEALSSDVGHQLIQAGVKPGDRVALCFEKSVRSVVSMLAVLRAGAVGVNIDPSLPQARITAILEVAEPSLVLTSASSQPTVQSVQGRLPLIEVPSQTPAMTPTADIIKRTQWPSVKPEDVAFMIFTSGTTGTPKGIVLEHRHFATAFYHHREPLGAYAGMRSLHFCSYAWDMSLQEVFFTWVYGGCLCIPSETQRMSNLAGFIREHRVNWATMTPSALSILAPDEVPGLTTMLVAGENVPIELMETWSSRLRMINGYGPAEAFTCAAGQIEPSMHCLGRIGSMVGTAGWITLPNDVSRLAPLGSIGELLLEGPMVSRGYFNEAKKTLEAFIEAPEWLKALRPDGATGRVYRTGDLARFDETGSLHYAGRKDTQVKLRGQRIVLGDIEHQVQLHFTSAQQVVAEVIHPRHSASALLVAFIYQGPSESNEDQHRLLQDPDELFLQHSASVISTLQDALPVHMIPMAMFPIQRVPHSTTLKIDRRQLREQAEKLTPDQLQCYTVGGHRSNAPKQSPETPSEVMWQGLWAEVLSIPADSIGRDDHLFRMGGDSIAAIKLVAFAHREGLAHITFQDVFKHPRLRDIAAVSTVSTAVPTSIQDNSGPEPFALIKDVDTLMQTASEQCGVPVDSIRDIYPCTPLQASLIASTFHHRDAYLLLQSYTLADGIDIERLRNAWETIAEAHTILRTRIFQTSNGAAYQAVLGSGLEWSQLDTDNSTDSQPIVGLGTPLIRLTLSPNQLLLSIHHTLYDGWSLPLLASEVQKAYSGHHVQPPVQFNQFMAHVEGTMESAASFWRKELQDADPLHFPILPSLDYRPKPKCSIEKTITFPEASTLHNATAASKINLAWALVSRTYTNNNDVIVGVVSSGRTAPVAGIEGLLGPTIATVPLRIRVDPGQRVFEALEMVQANFAKQTAFEHFGLQLISQQGANAAAACQFQTLITVQSKQPGDQDSIGKEAWYRHEEILSDINQFSSHALMLQFLSSPGGSALEVTATFDPDVLPQAQMQRALVQFEYFLMQIQDIEDTQATTVRDLKVISSQDLEDMVGWNHLPSPANDDVGPCVHDLVHEKCQSQPDVQAIHAWDGDFTYNELDRHVSQLASHIQAFDVVRPDTFVALYFEKSRWTVVAQLAVLKAGGAFIMFDPSHPIDRLREVCGSVQPPLILASENQQGYASGVFDVPVVGVGHGLLKEGSPCLDCHKSCVKPSNAMYAITTSGTTGKPKVAVVEHRCFLANNEPMIDMLGLASDSRVFQFAGYSFDLMVAEHISTLMVGGCICIPSKFDRDNSLDETITKMNANWVMLTTSVVQSLSPNTVPTIKTMVQAGEPMNQGIVDRWASHVRLINGYGPAECTIITCSNKDDGTNTSPNIIGRAKSSATWIVDPETMDLVPIGSVGELIVEGEIVGRGYMNDPEKTAAAFVPRPRWLSHLRANVSDKPVYRTGDLVKYTADGSICYVRRKDLQIKLRGQRLELTDVEHQVQRCFPDALQVVAAVTSLKSNAALVALVLTSSASAQQSADTDVLLPATSNSSFFKDAQTAESALQERVPSYMVPTIFLPLSRVPRNVNGKLDRRQINSRLASLTRQELDAYNSSSAVLNPPENDLQRDIRAIWAVVLSIDPEEISIDHSFFQIGGDSITSMQVVAQAKNAGLFMNMQDLFKYRTIGQLAGHISQMTPQGGAEVNRPEQLEIFDKAVDLSPIQQMYFDFAPENPNLFVQSLMLRLGRADLDGQTITRAFDAVVETHSMLRARFKQSPDGKWTQSIPRNTNGAHYHYHDFGIHSQKEMESLCRGKQQTLDIQHGPLFIVNKFERHDDGTHWLNLMAHHLIIDLVSWRVILADLEQILTTGSAPTVPAISFLNWCELQADYATRSLPVIQEEDDQSTIAYWGDDVINHNTHQDADTYMAIVDKETSRLLLSIANDPLATQPVDIIQAAVLHSFVQLFPDRSAPMIFSEGHGREPWEPTIDITRTVGWFTTIWPTLVALEASEGMVTALRRTKDARRSTPANGWEYFTSCFLHPHGPKKKRAMEIILNYQGRYQQLERSDALLQLDTTNRFGEGSEVEDMPRFSLLDVSAQVIDECLHLQFHVNRRMKHQDRLQQWAGKCAESLREACLQLSTMQGCYRTASDFPLLSGLHSDQVDQFMTDLTPKIDNQTVEAIYPTSPIQRGMLMSQARNPQHYQHVVRWKLLPTDSAAGVSIDIEELGRAWQRVVDRHPGLRTVFLEISDEGTAHQVVLKGVSAAIWHGTELPQRDGVLTPPASALHLETSAEGHIMLNLKITHALFDGHSERLLRRDLALAYGNDLPLAPAPSYQDYIAYLHGRMSSANNDEAYWCSYLNSLSPCLFPRLLGDAETDQTHEANEEFESFKIDLSSTATVDEFCEKHGIALTTVYHIVWAIVLSCYTGTADVCFGYSVSARSAPVPGIQDMFGPVINTLIGRLHLQPDAPLLSVLQEYNDDQLNSLVHQHHSLGDTLNGIGASSSELFNTAISVQDRRSRHAESNPLSTINVVDAGTEDRSEYPLTLNVAVFEETTKALFSYHKSFLAPKYAMAIGETFAHVMLQVLSQPCRPICEIEALNDSQRTSIENRNGFVPKTVTTLVHQTIEQRSLEQPTAQAVCAWDGDFTYEELDQLSSALAEELINQGVGVETPVPLYMEKTRWTPVAVLGVMKAGGTFVLLDTSHPSARLRAICEDTQSPLVLASSSLISKAGDLSPCVIEIGDRLLAARAHTVRTPTVAVNESHAAYIVFTSGSTGKPKGIVVEHSSLSTSLQNTMSRCNITSTSRMLQFASHAFDVSVCDLLIALAAGGCVCIPSDEERTGGITSAMKRMRVNCSVVTPTVARLYDFNELPGFESLILGGEAISVADLTAWHGKAQVFVAYGPAESTIISTLTERLTMNSNPRNIGTGSGAVPWVMDRNNSCRLAPDGVVGELLLEGPIVARGYLNNPQKSSTSFVKPPAWLAALREGGPPVRLYRTGDLVRYAEDGSLVFIGRGDDQVKIRGQRLELGEVEVQVTRAFSGDHVLVEFVKNSDSAVLVAYVVQSDNEGSSSELHGALLQPPSKAFYDRTRTAVSLLQKAMPSYMIPSAFLPLAMLPKGPTGKTDRKRLREHAASMSQTELDAYSVIAMSRRTPSTPLEARLQELVAHTLNRSPSDIPLEEDLFQIGMDSMKAMTLVAAARRATVYFSVQMLFQHPRLSELAVALEEKQDVVRTPVQPSPLLEFADEICAEWDFDRNDVANIVPATYFQRNAVQTQYIGHVTVHFFKSPDLVRLKGAFIATLERHSVLRTAFVPFKDTFVQVVLRHLDLTTEETTTEDDPMEVVQAISRANSSHPIPFGKPGLHLLMVEGRGRVSISLRLHHAHFDGMSIYHLLNEAAALYTNPKCAFPYRLDYSDFIAHRVQRTTPGTFQFWRDMLQGSSMTYLGQDDGMDRPDRSRVDLLVTSSGVMPLPDVQNGITVATIVKAAWSLCLAQYAHSEDVVFGQLSTNRAMDIEGVDCMIGPGVNYVPVRVTLQSDWTANDLFQCVQGQHIRAMSHDTADWDELVAQSTSWPENTPVGTGVHYLAAPPLWNHDYEFAGEIPARNEIIDAKMGHTYPMLMCVPLPAGEDGQPMLGMSLSSPTIGQQVADELVSLFRETVAHLVTQPEGLVFPAQSQ
ncbi:acetyl-CoA synthetase-like protein [Penicillium brevicompactum]|uniref:acetyl-CoA synthetase-like protein n=1 Tax=Penicillium brevicompactum TaxID=5074 RepID=UPI00253FFFB1|nr:acetyl-CoA synthetase-like protein [Penicillium brevicompactum]KAJ5347939.1 acetyl-CoA synthetase-like protein [Penicillium brevicompactum]